MSTPKHSQPLQWFESHKLHLSGASSLQHLSLAIHTASAENLSVSQICLQDSIAWPVETGSPGPPDFAAFHIEPLGCYRHSVELQASEEVQIS